MLKIGSFRLRSISRSFLTLTAFSLSHDNKGKTGEIPAFEVEKGDGRRLETFLLRDTNRPLIGIFPGDGRTIICRCFSSSAAARARCSPRAARRRRRRARARRRRARARAQDDRVRRSPGEAGGPQDPRGRQRRRAQGHPQGILRQV